MPQGYDIRLHINSFSTESCCDHLYIYEIDDKGSSHQKGQYSGSPSMFSPALFKTNKLRLEFRSDSSSVSSGFSIGYSSGKWIYLLFPLIINTFIAKNAAPLKPGN